MLLKYMDLGQFGTQMDLLTKVLPTRANFTGEDEQQLPMEIFIRGIGTMDKLMVKGSLLI